MLLKVVPDTKQGGSTMKKLRLTILLLLSVLAIASLEAQTKDTQNADMIGEWFAQINIPQNHLTILMEFDFLNSEDCLVKCKWIGENRATKEESGKAKYIMTCNRLTIAFLNEDELISYDHVFMMKNVYDIKRESGRFIIVNNRMFRNVDVPFGKGYENRGFAKITF